ncbi:hypothetical protein RQP46_003674 [Phenoliferia psychrophenolica]
MSHLAPSFSTLPPELKGLIARMARDQDKLYRSRQLSTLPHDLAERDTRTELSRNVFQRPLYGTSLLHLAEVNRDWHDAAARYLNESITALHLAIFRSLRERQAEEDIKTPGGPLHPRLLAFDHIKHRIKHLVVRQAPPLCQHDTLDHVIEVLLDLPNVDTVSVRPGDFGGRPQDLNDEAAPPPSMAHLFWQSMLKYPTIALRMSSLTIAFEVDEPQSSKDRLVLAGLITALPSLVHLRINNPSGIFSQDEDEDDDEDDDREGLKAALVGAQHLTSLSLQLPPVIDGQGDPELYMAPQWATWKPKLKVFEAVTDEFTNGLAAFVVGLAPTLERLSLSYQTIIDIANNPSALQENPPDFFPFTSFPSLSHLHISGDSHDMVLESFLDAPISSLRITFTEANFCHLLADESLLDRYLPSLRLLRLDYEPSQPEPPSAKLRKRCEDAGVVFLVGPSTAIGALECPHRDLSGDTALLLQKTMEMAKRNDETGDEMRKAELSKALDGIRVLLKMQNE